MSYAQAIGRFLQLASDGFVRATPHCQLKGLLCNALGLHNPTSVSENPGNLRCVLTGIMPVAEITTADVWLPVDAERPSFHLMPKQGWLNDPNGPLYYQGHYHVYVSVYAVRMVLEGPRLALSSSSFALQVLPARSRRFRMAVWLGLGPCHQQGPHSLAAPASSAHTNSGHAGRGWLLFWMCYHCCGRHTCVILHGCPPSYKPNLRAAATSGV
jgi:hypothetical protein